MSTLKATTNSNSTNLGVGAILGSGAIAFTLIPAFCAFFASETLQLKRRPLLRDMLTYLLALSLLSYVFLDGVISLHESLSLLALYFLYILIIIFAPLVRRCYRKHILGETIEKLRSFVEEREDQALVDSTSTPLNRGVESATQYSTNGEGSESTLTERECNGRDYDGDDDASEHLYSDREDRHAQPSISSAYGDVESIRKRGKLYKKMYKILVLPLEFAFTATCPPCIRGTWWEPFYLITFTSSILWITLFSFGISHIVEYW